jgi:protein-L-isoaspartate(D-aspartate) O-methyltransferase
MIDVHFDLASEEIGRAELSDGLRRALLAVPRHLFVPTSLMAAAYQDTPLPIGFDKTVSQPFIGAVMIEMLGLNPGDRVLEIGTGLGFQAAVMTEMGAEVSSVEIVEEFAEAAGGRFTALGYDVKVRIGDGSRGWEERAPFDAILVTAAAASPPPALIDQLEPGGKMVLPVGPKDSPQQLTIVEKLKSGDVDVRPVMPVVFTMLEV